MITNIEIKDPNISRHDNHLHKCMDKIYEAKKILVDRVEEFYRERMSELVKPISDEISAKISDCQTLRKTSFWPLAVLITIFSLGVLALAFLPLSAIATTAVLEIVLISGVSVLSRTYSCIKSYTVEEELKKELKKELETKTAEEKSFFNRLPYPLSPSQDNDILENKILMANITGTFIKPNEILTQLDVKIQQQQAAIETDVFQNLPSEIVGKFFEFHNCL